MSETSWPVVPFDDQVARALSEMPAREAAPPTREGLPRERQMMRMTTPVLTDLDGTGVESEELRVQGFEGAELEATLFRPAGVSAVTPVLVNFHGGGTITGFREMDNGRLVGLVAELGVKAVNVEYRLAPEHPHPVPVEDCYAATVWVAEHATRLGIDPGRIVVMGGSAGGLLAAGVSLLARDRGTPAILAQMLLCPMLDDRNETVSSHQYDGVGTWQRDTALFAWDCLLDGGAGGPDVSQYAAPARARDVSGLPPAFIEVGTAEMFRDEDVEYASRIWATGGQAELLAWSGGCHGFDMFAPETELSDIALKARSSWLRRTLRLLPSG